LSLVTGGMGVGAGLVTSGFGFYVTVSLGRDARGPSRVLRIPPELEELYKEPYLLTGELYGNLLRPEYYRGSIYSNLQRQLALNGLLIGDTIKPTITIGLIASDTKTPYVEHGFVGENLVLYFTLQDILRLKDEVESYKKISGVEQIRLDKLTKRLVKQKKLKKLEELLTLLEILAEST